MAIATCFLMVWHFLLLGAQATTPEAGPTLGCPDHLLRIPLRIKGVRLHDEINKVDMVDASIWLTVAPANAWSNDNLWSNALTVYSGTAFDLYATGTRPEESALARFFSSPRTIEARLWMERPYDFNWLTSQTSGVKLWNTLDSTHFLYSVHSLQNQGYDPSARRGAYFKSLPNGFKLITLSDYGAWRGLYRAKLITVTYDLTKPERVSSVDIKVYKDAFWEDLSSDPKVKGGQIIEHYTATDFTVVPELPPK